MKKARQVFAASPDVTPEQQCTGYVFTDSDNSVETVLFLEQRFAPSVVDSNQQPALEIGVVFSEHQIGASTSMGTSTLITLGRNFCATLYDARTDAPCGLLKLPEQLRLPVDPDLLLDCLNTLRSERQFLKESLEVSVTEPRYGPHSFEIRTSYRNQNGERWPLVHIQPAQIAKYVEPHERLERTHDAKLDAMAIIREGNTNARSILAELTALGHTDLPHIRSIYRYIEECMREDL